MPHKHMRRQLFVEPSLQGALLTRCMLYWAMCLLAVFVSLLCWEVMTGPARVFYTHLDEMWFKYGPVLLFTLALTPIMVLDFLRLSNRFAGPMVRLRRTMRGLAQGEPVEPIVLRRRDFWRDFAEDFNTVIARIAELEAAAATQRVAEGNRQAMGSDRPTAGETADAAAAALTK